LEAAKALMCIPGNVAQSSCETQLPGRWELVRPEELRRGRPLSKLLPGVVSKSSEMTLEAYQRVALKMTPPQVMTVPEAWNPKTEPLYLVVDPANVSSNRHGHGNGATAANRGSI